ATFDQGNRRKGAGSDSGRRRRVRLAAIDRGLKELEGGCRAIKLAMGRERDEQMEQRYYRFQLMSRRRQKGAPFGEKLFSLLYGAFGDYGASMVRPFIALGVILVGFAAVYYSYAATLGLLGKDTLKAAWDAFDFSLANVFKPLSALSIESAGVGT